MSTTLITVMIAMGIAGHAVNMYCDRILSIFPNGTIDFSNIKDIGKEDMAARIMEGVSDRVPLRSAILGAMALVLQLLGYSGLAFYTYGYSHIYGGIMFVLAVIFCVIGSAYHVKCAFAEYAFIKLGRDEKAKEMMLALMKNGNVLRVCMAAMLAYLIVLVIAIVTGTIGFPLWALVFTIVPIFIVMFPLRIIGTLHIGAMVSMLGWIILINMI